jgi:hypothetical protein
MDLGENDSLNKICNVKLTWHKGTNTNMERAILTSLKVCEVKANAVSRALPDNFLSKKQVLAQLCSPEGEGEIML